MPKLFVALILSLHSIFCSGQVVTIRHIGVSDKPICTLRFSPKTLSRREACETIVQINGNDIQPDVVVPQTLKGYLSGRDEQLDAAIDLLSK
jgi:hypothetical protein